MSSHLLKLLALLALCSLCACQTPQPRSATPRRAATTTTAKKTFDLPARNNAWALLEELLNEEKHLSKILIIKRESSELNRLVKKHFRNGRQRCGPAESPGEERSRS